MKTQVLGYSLTCCVSLMLATLTVFIVITFPPPRQGISRTGAWRPKASSGDS